MWRINIQPIGMPRSVLDMFRLMKVFALLMILKDVTCEGSCGDVEENVVYFGEDLNNGFQNKVDSIEKCRSLCQANGNCVGWNYGQAVGDPRYQKTCWIKNKLTKRIQNIAGWMAGHRDCGGYCKDPKQDVAHIGNDLNNGLQNKRTSLKSCQALCKNLPNCVAVNWGGVGRTGAKGKWKRSCWIKDSLRGKRVKAAGFVTAGRRNCSSATTTVPTTTTTKTTTTSTTTTTTTTTSKPNVPCLSDEQDVVYFGNDLLDGRNNLKNSREYCRESCQATHGCNGWVWGGRQACDWNHTCWLKTSLAGRKVFPGSVFWSGTRDCITSTPAKTTPIASTQTPSHTSSTTDNSSSGSPASATTTVPTTTTTKTTTTSTTTTTTTTTSKPNFPCLSDEQDVVYFDNDLLDGKNNLKNSLEDCRESCQATRGCNGWVWGGCKACEWKHTCWLKTSLAGRKVFPASMFWSGTRDCISSTPTKTTPIPSTQTPSHTSSTTDNPSSGSPGRVWSVDDLRIVRSKLWRLFANGQGTQIVQEYLALNPNKFDNIRIRPDQLRYFDDPSAAKVVRLVFHDCLKNKDGSGGCDGCLDWSGVFQRDPARDPLRGGIDDRLAQRKYPDVTETDNNGLGLIVLILEEIYTNPSFPALTPVLPQSLKVSGKSRADFWAYASMVAVEFTIEENNRFCRQENITGRDHVDTIGKSFFENFNGQCHHNAGEANCQIILKKPFQFESGRSDCVTDQDEPYKAHSTSVEVHPNPNTNGDGTMDFFRDQFGFNGQETVAIFGAHTLGRKMPLQIQTGFFRYTWTAHGGDLFNNAYYKNIVNENDWFINDNGCNKIGRAWDHGKQPTHWVIDNKHHTKSGGPTHWLKLTHACPNCAIPESEVRNIAESLDEYKKCCPNRPEGSHCVPDTDADTIINAFTGCEKFRTILAGDEFAMNCEIGLFFNFIVSKGGIPTGCPGFTANRWGDQGGQINKKLISQFEARCGHNMRPADGDGTPVNEFMRLYARDQDRWVRDYILAHEKMLRNGVNVKNLSNAPDHFTGVVCNIPVNPIDVNRSYKCF